MDNLEITKWIIDSAAYMTIATADQNGKPWISPVGFGRDEDWNFYWVSSKESIHSKNIRFRKEIAISIVELVVPGVGTDGVYIDATAIELNEKSAIDQGISALQVREAAEHFKVKSIDDVSGESIWRMYRASPLNLWKRDDHIDEKSGQAITVRMPIVLDQ